MAGWPTVIIMLLSPAGAWAWAELGNIGIVQTITHINTQIKIRWSGRGAERQTNRHAGMQRGRHTGRKKCI